MIEDERDTTAHDLLNDLENMPLWRLRYLPRDQWPDLDEIKSRLSYSVESGERVDQNFPTRPILQGNAAFLFRLHF